MRKVYGCVFLTAFLFATMEVSLKIAGAGMDPFQLTFLRFFFGGLILLPLGIKEMKQRNVIMHFRDWMFLLLVGTTGIPVSMLFFQLGVMNCNASTASVLISINTVFTMIFAHFILGERMNRDKAIVVIMGMIGIFLMIRPWDIQEGNSMLGIIYMIIAAVTFGLYTCIGKISTAKMGVFAQTSFSFILGSMVLLVVIVITGRPVFEGIIENWAIVSYTSIFVTGIGYLSYFTAIKHSDAVTGSIAFLLKPAMAPVIAVIVLHEVILWNTLLGIVCVLAASTFNIYVQRRAAARSLAKLPDSGVEDGNRRTL